MKSLRMKPAIFLALSTSFICDVQAWVSPMRLHANPRTSFGKSVLGMAEDGADKVQLTSGKKEIMFDEKSGRFFETSLDAAECIPDEEFCTIDADTGNRIRLTVAEKERIFLDSLQVGLEIGQCLRKWKSQRYLTLFSLVVLR
jgi:hypothetical protein